MIISAILIHKSGLRHHEFEERNILCLNSRPIIIDFEWAKPHDCKFVGLIAIGGVEPSPYELGCQELHWICLEANIWRPGPSLSKFVCYAQTRAIAHLILILTNFQCFGC